MVDFRQKWVQKLSLSLMDESCSTEGGGVVYRWTVKNQDHPPPSFQPGDDRIDPAAVTQRRACRLSSGSAKHDSHLLEYSGISHDL